MTISRNRWRHWLSLHRLMRQNGTYGRSLRVAVLVGTVLNLTNQPEIVANLASFDVHGIQRTNAVKALLTYIVPFLVATYGALAAVRLPAEQIDTPLQDQHKSP